MTSLVFNVNGIPGAQGSKRHVGRGILVESSKKVAPWRTDVREAAEAAREAYSDWAGPIDGPVEVSIGFRFYRPKSHYGTGRNAGVVKASAPEWPTGKNLGDLDKLTRSSFDALTSAGIVTDDSRIVVLRCLKRWCDPDEAQGATFRVIPLSPIEVEAAVAAADAAAAFEAAIA